MPKILSWILNLEGNGWKYSSVVLFINNLIISVFVFLIRVWQKNIRKPWPGLFTGGHPAKHGRHPKDIKDQETEGKSWCFRLWIIQRGYGPAERAGQKLKDQPTCQVLGDKFVCLIMSMIISFENVPFVLPRIIETDIFLTVFGFVKLWLTSWSRVDSQHIFTWPLPLQPAWFTSWVVLYQIIVEQQFEWTDQEITLLNFLVLAPSNWTRCQQLTGKTQSNRIQSLLWGYLGIP